MSTLEALAQLACILFVGTGLIALATILATGGL